MGIRKRGKHWIVDVRDGKGRRIRRSVGTSKAVAVLTEKDLQLKIARGQYLGIFDTNHTPFSEYAKEWLERKKMNVSQSTWRDYKSTLEVHALPHFGRMPLNQIRRRDVEEFLDKLGALSAKRKNNVMVPVKNIFNDAMRREDLRDNPCQLIRRFKEEKPLIDPFSFPEMKAFLDAVDPHYVAYFTTAFLSGMRPNEMLALKWLHVDFEMRCITIREGRVQGIEGPPKTLSSFRDVDMLEPLRQVLLQHRAVSPQDALYVFRNRHGNPLGVDNLRNKVWYPALKKAGLRMRTMYQTRHTFASLMLSHGEDPLWIARMLGHTTLQMVFQHYGKFIRNRARKDGLRFAQGLAEAGLVPSVPNLPEGPAVSAIPEKSAKPLPARPDEHSGLSMDSKVGHKLGTVVDFAQKKGLRFPVTP
ncbi:MAG: site-specific integrase [bacterium]|jgi:integrase